MRHCVRKRISQLRYTFRTVIARRTYRSADSSLVRWFEGRYVWMFTDCGFDARIRAIVSDETGIEAGGRAASAGRVTTTPASATERTLSDSLTGA